jgi:hypothetical protein
MIGFKEKVRKWELKNVSRGLYSCYDLNQEVHD